MTRQFQLLADQAFSRTAGAPLVGGNAVRLLKDGSENYPAWLDAIRSAQHWIHFETYILHDDKIGKVFAEALCERARAGVKVRLLVDWLGSMLKIAPEFWRTFAQGRRRGAELWLSHDRFAARLGVARSPQVALSSTAASRSSAGCASATMAGDRRLAAKRSAIPA